MPVKRLLKTMKFKQPWFVMHEIILYPKRFPIATKTEVMTKLNCFTNSLLEYKKIIEI